MDHNPHLIVIQHLELVDLDVLEQVMVLLVQVFPETIPMRVIISVVEVVVLMHHKVVLLETVALV